MNITPELCMSCGACCSAWVDGELIACRHLDTSAGYRCRIYATRPKICRDYTCVRDGRISNPAIAKRVNIALAA